MGTNYYWEQEPCECCGRSDRIHIGKSSRGWCFSLHVYPNKEVESLADWIRIWINEPGDIFNQYGETLSVEQMLCVIMDRHMEQPVQWQEREYRRQHAYAGPNNLLRHEIENRGSAGCLGPGPGTWDLMFGDYS